MWLGRNTSQKYDDGLKLFDLADFDLDFDLSSELIEIESALKSNRFEKRSAAQEKERKQYGKESAPNHGPCIFKSELPANRQNFGS